MQELGPGSSLPLSKGAERSRILGVPIVQGDLDCYVNDKDSATIVMDHKSDKGLSDVLSAIAFFTFAGGKDPRKGMSRREFVLNPTVTVESIEAGIDALKSALPSVITFKNEYVENMMASVWSLVNEEGSECPSRFIMSVPQRVWEVTSGRPLDDEHQRFFDRFKLHAIKSDPETNTEVIKGQMYPIIFERASKSESTASHARTDSSAHHEFSLVSNYASKSSRNEDSQPRSSALSNRFNDRFSRFSVLITQDMIQPDQAQTLATLQERDGIVKRLQEILDSRLVEQMKALEVVDVTQIAATETAAQSSKTSPSSIMILLKSMGRPFTKRSTTE